MKNRIGNRALAGAALLALGTAPAAAQDFILPPDYSQVLPGLPLSPAGIAGGNYCGPASAADYMQWLHDNGYPDVSPIGVTPEAQALSIFLLGVLVDTDPTSGTTPENMADGLQFYLDSLYPGAFDVGYVGRDCEGAVAQALGHTFATIILQLEVGHLAIARVGWYELPGGNRCKGHFVAMTGYLGLGGTSWRARYRDPARETDTISTKDTTFELLALEDGDGVIRNQWASSWNWPRDGSTATGCNDLPRTGVQDGLVYIGGMQLFSPPAAGGTFTGFNLANGQYSTYLMGGTSTATSLAPHPYVYDLYHCNPNDNQIYKTDFRTGQVSGFQVAFSLSQPRRLAFAADGTLLVLQGNTSPGFDLLAIKPDGSLIAKVTQPTLGAIAYHDAANRVYWWTGPTNQLLLFDPSLGSAGPPIQLPSGPVFAAPGYLAADPRRNVIYYNHQGSNSIFRFDVFKKTALPPIASTLLVDPAEMVCDNRGHLYVARGSAGSILEFDTDGNPVSGSPAGSLSGSKVLGITRSPRRPVVPLPAFGGADTDVPLDLPFADCNQNGIPDDQDIAGGWSLDVFLHDGIPDECQTAPKFKRN